MQKSQAGKIDQSAIPESVLSRSGTIEVAIPYKTPEMTAAALESASALGHELNVHLRLIQVHVVPYALPMDKPSVQREHLEANLCRIVESCDVKVEPELVFARDWEEGFRRSLRPRSVVLIPMQRSWWRSHDKRMAGRLRKHGHQVIWVECN